VPPPCRCERRSRDVNERCRAGCCQLGHRVAVVPRPPPHLRRVSLGSPCRQRHASSHTGKSRGSRPEPGGPHLHSRVEVTGLVEDIVGRQQGLGLPEPLPASGEENRGVQAGPLPGLRDDRTGAPMTMPVSRIAPILRRRRPDPLDRSMNQSARAGRAAGTRSGTARRKRRGRACSVRACSSACSTRRTLPGHVTTSGLKLSKDNPHRSSSIVDRFPLIAQHSSFIVYLVAVCQTRTLVNKGRIAYYLTVVLPLMAIAAAGPADATGAASSTRTRYL